MYACFLFFAISTRFLRARFPTRRKATTATELVAACQRGCRAEVKRVAKKRALESRRSKAARGARGVSNVTSYDVSRAYIAHGQTAKHQMFERSRLQCGRRTVTMRDPRLIPLTR